MKGVKNSFIAEEYGRLKAILSTLFFRLSERRCLSLLYRESRISTLYSSVSSFINSLSNLAFGNTKRTPSKKTLEKMKCIVSEADSLKTKGIIKI